MTTRADIDDFVGQRTLAVVGASRNPMKFGARAYRQLKLKGYQVYPVNPHAEIVEGDRAYASVTDLPAPVGGAVIVVPPAQTERVVRDVAAAGIRRVWMQQGSESPDAIRFCEDQGIGTVYGHCIIMFSDPVGFPHSMHRWVWGMIGKIPK